MNKAWMVTCYNGADASAGCNRATTVELNCTKEFAKAYARHMNKVSPDGVIYSAEPEPERYW